MKIKLLTHSNLVQVVCNPSYDISDDDGDSRMDEKFDSKLISKCLFKKGDLIARLRNFIEVEQPNYLTIQIGPSKHIYLNSDFNYLNHSCDPNVRIDIKQMAFIAMKDITPGTDLSFFYPSTEWDMHQSFECWCGSQDCLRQISGAKHIDPHLMNQLKKKHFFNDHILDLCKQNS